MNYDEELETTPTSLEISGGMKGVRDRIATVPKRAHLDGAPKGPTSEGDFTRAAALLGGVEAGLSGLWPQD